MTTITLSSTTMIRIITVSIVAMHAARASMCSILGVLLFWISDRFHGDKDCARIAHAAAMVSQSTIVYRIYFCAMDHIKMIDGRWYRWLYRGERNVMIHSRILLTPPQRPLVGNGVGVGLGTTLAPAYPRFIHCTCLATSGRGDAVGAQSYRRAITCLSSCLST